MRGDRLRRPEAWALIDRAAGPIAKIQAALAETATELRRIDQRLDEHLAALPPSAEYSDPLLDWEVPPTMEAELFTALEYIRYELLRPLVEICEKESRITLAMVEAEWVQRQTPSAKAQPDAEDPPQLPSTLPNS